MRIPLSLLLFVFCFSARAGEPEFPSMRCSPFQNSQGAIHSELGQASIVRRPDLELGNLFLVKVDYSGTGQNTVREVLEDADDTTGISFSDTYELARENRQDTWILRYRRGTNYVQATCRIL